jgi:nicotinamide mononucleotide (NMN) deamidase PncC
MLSTILSEAPGAAEHLHGGFVIYTKENKIRSLGVSEDLLTEKSAVCVGEPDPMLRRLPPWRRQYAR